MMSDKFQPIVYEQRYGRTWVDFWSSTGGFIVILILGGLLFYFGWDWLKQIPMWVWVSVVLTPIVWTPFLMARAKDDTHLLVVADGPQRLTEYRVGKRVDLDIDGAGLPLTSKTGNRRTLLTDFDPITRKGEGTALAEFTQFEMARDLHTLDRLSKAFAKHLREERITQELVAVEVERRVKELSQRWIGIAMATLEPNELESALEIQSQPEMMDLEPELDVILDE